MTARPCRHRRPGGASVLAALVLGVALATQAADPADEVRAFFREWALAVESMSVDRAMASYADDFLQSGMDRSLHKLAYTAQFALVRLKGGRLRVQADVRDIRFWDLGPDAQFADVDVVVYREEVFDKDRFADRLFQPVRLRRVEGQWKACGDKTRTLVVVQVAYDGEETALTLTAQSAFPTFPCVAWVEGPGLPRQAIKTLKRDILGKPYVTETVYVHKPPARGDVFQFSIPYPDGDEVVRYEVRGEVKALPEITAPAPDAEARQWPLNIAWKDVSPAIRDFGTYEVHVRRAKDGVAVFLFRSRPAGSTSVVLGEMDQQRALFTQPHEPYYVEVYAYDVFGNYGLARRRFYDLTAVPADKPQPAAEAPADKPAGK